MTSIDQARTDVQQAVRALIAIADSTVPASAASAERRLWSEMLALGRALDRNGDFAEGRTALERAAGLAPTFFETRWSLAHHRLHSRFDNWSESASQRRRNLRVFQRNRP